MKTTVENSHFGKICFLEGITSKYTDKHWSDLVHRVYCDIEASDKYDGDRIILANDFKSKGLKFFDVDLWKNLRTQAGQVVDIREHSSDEYDDQRNNKRRKLYEDAQEEEFKRKRQ